jgi:APA family basic amino acid/polyamine antiporter
VGIIGTLVVCSLLYISVALVLTGIANYKTLNNAAPVATALKALGYDGIRKWVSIGAVVGMLSSLLVFQYGQARVWFAMSRDGLLPKVFSKVHPVHRTPHVSTWIAGFAVGIPAGVWDIGTFADLSNIGTLFAFVVVSAGVLILRKTQPNRPRGFRVPLGPVLPSLSILCCLILMMGLPVQTWLRFFGWSALGLAIYFLFGKKNSALAKT